MDSKNIQLIMQKVQQIKSPKNGAKEIKRYQSKNSKNTQKHKYETTTSNYLINVRFAKPRKCSQKIITQRQKAIKPKKIKYINDEIAQSTSDLLSIETKSQQKEKSVKISIDNIEEENIYQLCRSTKKSHYTQERQEEKQLEVCRYQNNINLRKITEKKEKTRSKDSNLKFKSPKVRYKSTKKINIASRSKQKSQKNLKSRQFLSPQIVKQQNSYYFQAFNHSQPKSTQNILLIPKKQSKFIFESSMNLWNDYEKKIMNSTIDLLN